MKVSVRVVEGASLQMTASDKVVLSKQATADLGILTLRGMKSDNYLVEVSNRLKLYGDDGSEMDLNVKGEKEKRQESGSQQIHFISSSPQATAMATGASYRGAIKAKVEYL